MSRHHVMTTTTPSRRCGTMVVLSGPSGAGKTTVYRRVLGAHRDIHFSVSCTTRPRRAGEHDGVDYHFLTRETFEQHIEAGEFLEYASVHGNLYGTLREDVEPHVFAGVDVLLDVDVQGARQVRAAVRDTPLAPAILLVFCVPPSYADLQERLKKRATDEPAVIQRRLQNAVAELRAWREYEYVLVNDEVDSAAKRLEAIILAARCRTAQFQHEPWTQ